MRRLTAFSIVLVLLLSLAPGAPPPTRASDPPPARGRIEPAVLRAALDDRAPLTFIVHLRAQAVLPDQAQAPTAVAQRRAVVAALQTTARQSQAGLRGYLAQAQAAGHVRDYQSFWITNAVLVTGDRAALLAIAARPDVDVIRENRVHQLDEPELVFSNTTDSSAVEWNIAHVRADLVWSALGLDGTGVVVANVDTGVDWQHPALQSRYRSYVPGGLTNHAQSWYCATDEGCLYPVDNYNHGTHTMGTLVGLGGIGMAPGARWIAVKAFNQYGVGYDAWLHAAFQWLLAPNGDPALAPDVVNNSWGNSNGAYEVFRDDIRALRAAGIVPVCSAGNRGAYGAGTVGAPGSYPESLTVGATDQYDVVTTFSSQGPSPWGLKPDVAAPGVYIRSSIPGGGYAEQQGTSMAAPHVAGLVALLRQARPDLTVTATIQAITSTARTSGQPVPNNTAGWGCLDAYAAVRAVYGAGLISGTVSSAGAPRPGAAVALVNHDTGATARATTDAAGRYQIGVAPGRYDITASAFGYAPVTVYGVPVLTGAITTRDFALTALPTGVVAGTILRTGVGSPIAATVEAVGTPARAVASASTGFYSLTLPPGEYDLRVTAWGYRVAHAHVTITAGGTVGRDFLLDPAPTILLVDSGAWYYDSRVASYQAALDDLDYVYHVRTITTTYINGTSVFTTPQFTPYDVVIWSAPQDAPGFAGAEPALTGYLNGGGKLFLSGQDVGFWDGGGSGLFYAPYYTTHLRAQYVSDDSGGWNLVGAPVGPLAGLSLTLNGPDSAHNQLSPDLIQPLADAQDMVDYAGAGCAGLGMRTCAPYRVVYLAFGLEGVSGASQRAEVLRRALDWMDEAPPIAGLDLTPADQGMARAPGALVTYTLRLRNAGLVADNIALSVTAAAWPTTLWNADLTRPITYVHNLTACVPITLGVQVLIPPHTPPHTADMAVVTARSAVSPALIVTAGLRTKTPAPILLVDGGRWYDTSSAYRAALDANGLAYDYWDTLVPNMPRDTPPPAEQLRLYAQVIWWTGYDWYQPLTVADEAHLADYLDGGGRLFLSSQDYLYYHGNDAFARDYMGVLTYTQEVTVTRVMGQAGNPVGAGLGPYALIYPFRNNSDHVTPTLPADIAWLDAVAGDSCGITHRDAARDARTVFLSWPFEALPVGSAAGAVVLDRIVSWLAPLGDSTLAVDRAIAASGDELAYTLTLRNADARTVSTTATLALPGHATYVPGSAAGGDYDPARRAIVWAGAVAPHDAHAIACRATLDDPLPPGAVVTATAILTDDTALALRRPARTEINVPLLDVVWQSSAAVAGPGAVLTYTARLTNTGTATAVASLTDTLPAPLTYVPGSAWASNGTVTAGENTVTWAGALLPGEAVAVRLAAQTPLTVPNGLRLWNAVQIDDGWHPTFTRQVAVTTEAPDLTPSTKRADRPLAQPGEPITYTVALVNAGDWPATGATLSDTLPAGATYVAGSVTGGAWYDSSARAIRWAGAVSTHESVTITYRLTLDPGPVQGATFVNHAHIGDGRGLSIWCQAVVTVPFRSYLPLAARQ